MRKQQTEPTTAANLENKFDAGKEVLDYFDVAKTAIVAADRKPSSSLRALKRNALKEILVRERPRGYRTKKKK